MSAASYEDEEYGLIEMAYAHFRPAADGAKHPLIVWLHGGGEGGTEATIPLSANRACYFAADHIQAYFDGAFVLVPQAPTRWMDDGTERPRGTKKKNATSIYTRAVQDLVASHVAQNPDIDPDRIYVGGASNGGFLAVRMILSYPEFYAAAFPSAEPLNDTYVTDEEIEAIVDTPIWFVNSAMDRTVEAPDFCLKLYDRLCKQGAPNVYLSYLRRVIDESGLYKNEDGTPYEYNGHWSWIYYYNNDLTQVIDGRTVSFMEWLAAQSR
jgi:predicted peptidase